MRFSIIRSRNRPYPTFLGIAAIALYAVLLSTSAHAYLISAGTNWSIGTGAATSSPRDGSDFQSVNSVPSDPPLLVSASSSNILTFNAYSTVWNTASLARATPTELGVSTSFSLTDFDTNINGQLNQGAQARFRDVFSIDALGTVYLSPIFDLVGTLSATPGIDIGLILNVTINTVTVPGTTELFTLIDVAAPNDGTVLAVNANVAPTTSYAAPAGSSIQVDVGLAAMITDLQLTSLSDGVSYAALADFYSTSTFRGFAVYEDAAMLIPVTSGVLITSTSTGAIIPIVTQAVPVPATAWLFGSGLLGLIGIARRKKAA